MQYNTSELCDFYADLIDVIDPIFFNYGGRNSFAGKVVTIKCFEIDGGGSTRRALINLKIAQYAVNNGWEGIVCYGSVRDVDALEELDIGIQALAAIPVGASDQSIGDTDVAINFAGVTLLPDDYIYADNTGIILSPEPLDIK